MNGMTGCRSLKDRSVAASMFFHPFVRPDPSTNESFFNSMYQSQNSCQKKWYSVLATSWYRNFSICSLACAATVLRRE